MPECSVTKALSSFCQRYQIDPDSERLVIAVSGGPDSMALCCAVLYVFPDALKNIVFVTVDHALREESAQEALQVGQWLRAKERTLHHDILRWEEPQKPVEGLMEAARRARYDLLQSYCKDHQARHLFLAHHQDDQMETFLFRLAKGSGLDGLSAMDDRTDKNGIFLCRPFLDLQKQDLVSFCHQNTMPFVQDPSNANERFMRPRLRAAAEVLKTEGLTAERIGRTAKRLRRARKALEAYAAQAYAAVLIAQTQDAVSLSFEKMQHQPEELIIRIVQKAMDQVRPAPSYPVRLERLEDLLESLMQSPQTFRRRTLGGFMFALKDKNRLLWIEKEKPEGAAS